MDMDANRVRLGFEQQLSRDRRMTDERQEAFNERAAIIEYLGGLSREEADRAALAELDLIEFEQGTASRQRILPAE